MPSQGCVSDKRSWGNLDAKFLVEAARQIGYSKEGPLGSKKPCSSITIVGAAFYVIAQIVAIERVSFSYAVLFTMGIVGGWGEGSCLRSASLDTA